MHSVITFPLLRFRLRSLHPVSFFLSVPFARCDIALIQPKHVERSGISPGISGRGKSQPLSLSLFLSVLSAVARLGAACVVEQRGLLGMNVVSATFDPESC